MSPLEHDLDRARAAYAERSWLEAYEAFVRTDGCLELQKLADTYESAILEAIVVHAQGAVTLVEGDAASALPACARHSSSGSSRTLRTSLARPG